MEFHPKILAIQSDKQELAKVEKFLKDLYNQEKLPEHTFNKVLLCVSEAVINSIEHGNKNQKGKWVTIEAKCKTGCIDVKITDEGEGFDISQVKNPTVPENIKKETGRGIFIMQSICNTLYFGDKGKYVEIKIELT